MHQLKCKISKSLKTTFMEGKDKVTPFSSKWKTGTKAGKLCSRGLSTTVKTQLPYKQPNLLGNNIKSFFNTYLDNQSRVSCSLERFLVPVLLRLPFPRHNEERFGTSEPEHKSNHIVPIVGVYEQSAVEFHRLKRLVSCDEKPSNIVRTNS